MKFKFDAPFDQASDAVGLKFSWPDRNGAVEATVEDGMLEILFSRDATYEEILHVPEVPVDGAPGTWREGTRVYNCLRFTEFAVTAMMGVLGNLDIDTRTTASQIECRHLVKPSEDDE